MLRVHKASQTKDVDSCPGSTIKLFCWGILQVIQLKNDKLKNAHRDPGHRNELHLQTRAPHWNQHSALLPTTIPSSSVGSPLKSRQLLMMFSGHDHWGEKKARPSNVEMCIGWLKVGVEEKEKGSSQIYTTSGNGAHLSSIIYKW